MSDSFGYLETNEHGALPESVQREIKSYLEEDYSQDVVEDFYKQFGWMYEWKAHRRSENGVKLAVAYTEALGLKEEEIKSYEKIDRPEVTEEHVQVAEELHDIGEEWFRTQFGDSVQVYRGFKDGGLEMLETLYQDDSDTFEINDNVLSNWTLDEDVSMEWGRRRSRFRGAVVRAERDIEDFIMAIDGIAGDFTNHHDSALTFRGQVEVQKRNVSIEPGRQYVRDYEAESDSPLDKKRVSYRGSFYPWRSVEEQGIEALKSIALDFGDSSIGISLGGDLRKDLLLETVTDVRERLANELDPDNPKDEQVLEAARKGEENIRKWL